MSLLRFAFGLVLVVTALAPVGLGAGALRRRLLPGWAGLDALLADVVLALTLVLVTTEALGTVGWFRTAPVVVGLAAMGLVTWRLASAGPPPPPTPAPTAAPPPVPLAEAAVTAAVVAVVAGAWVARTHRALERGMETVDTLWYHLPVAARFVQTGDTWAVHYVDADAVTAFFPASAPVLHGLGMLLLGSDVASTAMNAWWLALGLAAAWSLGRRAGVAPATTTGAALLLLTPGLVATQPGGAYTDVVGLALLLVAGALLLHPADGPRPLGQDAAVALAAGLSIGTKFTFVGPAAVLCLALVVTAGRAGWPRRLGAVLGAVAVSGGYWYLRNAAVAGNPIPTLDVGIGPLSLASLPSATPPATVAEFLLDGSAWRDWFVPGLRSSLGPAWPAIAAAVLAGIGLGTRRSGGRRLLAVVGGLSLVLFLVTPQYLLIGGEPYFFVFNLRYATPALLLGLVVLPLALPGAGRWVLAAYATAAAATALDPTSFPWPFDWAVLQDRAVGRDALWGALGAGALLVLWWLATSGRAPRLADPRGGVAALAAVSALALAAALPSYRDGRYDGTPPFPETFAWARTNLDGSRIVVAGLLTQVKYPLFGDDRRNHVQYAGIVEDDAGFRPATSCAEWATLLRTGRYDHVLLTPGTVTTDPPREAEWTEQLGGRLVHEEEPRLEGDLLSGTIGVRVYELDPDAVPAGCP